MLATAIRNNSTSCSLSFEKMNLFFIRDVKLNKEAYKNDNIFRRGLVSHEKIKSSIVCFVLTGYFWGMSGGWFFSLRELVDIGRRSIGSVTDQMRAAIDYRQSITGHC